MGERFLVFVDTEIDFHRKCILDIGAVDDKGNSFHNTSLGKFTDFLSGVQYVCGHNIIRHDALYIGGAMAQAGVKPQNIIDTLFLSPLLFPTKPYHALLKDDKLQTEELNNPLNDSFKARDLFYDEISAFTQMSEDFRKILFLLLREQSEFSAFFNFIRYRCTEVEVEPLIRQRFVGEICSHVDLSTLIAHRPIALAYCLALINSFIKSANSHSITPPWVLKNYPEVEQIMLLLRNKPCVEGCIYCDRALDIHRGLKRFFGYDSYRTYGGESLQERAVKDAVDGKSLLAVFPTGGGKSITFQVPALMSGEHVRGLTIVISPLQSLMKDQVDNLERIGITEAVTINGLLDPLERAESFKRVEDGSASLLYISPESLRSKTIERLILGRKVVRFVIDEAHCFSAWGQDFRVDYLYIGDFIRHIQEKKNLDEAIPVSCFTATAKQKVIEDIRNYFQEKLHLTLNLHISKVARTNLHYKVFPEASEEEKYQALRNLIEGKNCPTIVYVSRTQKAEDLARQLCRDGFRAKAYHGKLDKQKKSENQDAFIRGEVDIMVATSAFGMGVDKKDVGLVVHYDISDSLENYVQEAGRAGRDEHIEADCFVLFNQEDLSKHFILLNQTKLSIKEIQQVWRAIKDITKIRTTVSNSALEIARRAGWDHNVAEIETRVTTAIAALENAGYLKRGQNMPQIFANSILTKTASEAIEKINASERFEEKQKATAIRIIKKLFSSKSRKQTGDELAESRVDYISDHLGIVKEEVINIITLLREENILADTKDLTAFIKRGEQMNRSLALVKAFYKMECFLLSLIDEKPQDFHIKQLNEDAEKAGCSNVTNAKINTIFNFWLIKHWIKKEFLPFSKNHIRVYSLQPKATSEERLKKRYELAQFIVEFLYERSSWEVPKETTAPEEVLVEFSVHELKSAYESSSDLFKISISIDDIEDTLFYLSRIEAIKIEGGFLVTYNRLTIQRLEQGGRKQYTKEDYQQLNQFYENKIQQIHIVGEYAQKMISNYKEALQFVDDYFQLNYTSFLTKYFKGDRGNEIKKNITPTKFKQLFGELSPTQLKIINDSEARYIVVAAGPGSGKTRVLVHKLASLLLMEDVKHEQLLMLTFSRAAATEFKKRLLKLIGNAANFVEIKTFHSYCFDLLGRVGSIEKSDDILKKTIQKIQSGEVEPNRITKTVLVIDEAQDMNADEFALISTLMEQNEEMRVIAVGDDDQNIYAFRGSDSKYFEQFIDKGAVKYELIENYRSKRNLVELANTFAGRLTYRLKEAPIVAVQKDNGGLKIVRYRSEHLIMPLVRDLLTSRLSGSTCVLTKTNEEALQVTGLLLKEGMPAKLIQSNDRFNLYNLAEIRFFLTQLALKEDVFIISDDSWEAAKRALKEKYAQSNKLSICEGMIRDFEMINPKRRYKSDWESFIRESRMEDFISSNVETILVSTVHKAKGKEFDNVFLLLENLNLITDEARRHLYVAMTRAKQNLTIHTNSNLFDFSLENLDFVTDAMLYSPLRRIAMHLTYRDVFLDYFIDKQHIITQMVSGSPLQFNKEGGLSYKGYSVVRFSQSFLKQIEERKEKGYQLKEAKVNLILYWFKEEGNREIQIILPELYFEKVE